jgi:hypothetical protein
MVEDVDEKNLYEENGSGNDEANEVSAIEGRNMA